MSLVSEREQIRSGPRFGGMRSLASAIEPALVVIAAIALWELLTQLDILPKEDIPPASLVFSELIADVQTSELWGRIWESVQAWGVGLAIAIIAGILSGMFLGSSRVTYRLARLSVEFLRTIPSIAALPLFVLLYGTGVELATVLVALAAVWPILIETMYGVQDVDPVSRDMARVYGLNRRKQFTRIVLPSALPYIMTGLRLSAIFGLIVAIATSLVAGGSGLGFAIYNASASGVPELAYARTLVAGLLGLLVTTVFIQIESYILRWHPSHRKVQS